MEGIKGAGIGSISAVLMPYIQLLKIILAAKRKWPLLINAGAINMYAWYVGTVFIGPSISLLIFAGLEGALALYGCGKGAYVGYTQGSALVPTLLWEGGLSCNTEVTDIKPSVLGVQVLAPVIKIESFCVTNALEIGRTGIGFPIKTCTWMYDENKNPKLMLGTVKDIKLLNNASRGMV